MFVVDGTGSPTRWNDSKIETHRNSQGQIASVRVRYVVPKKNSNYLHVTFTHDEE